MKKPPIIILAFFALAQSAQAQQPNYQAGDTLNIFTIGGLKLREGHSLSSRVLASMKLGEKVVVQSVFQTDLKYYQVIEGFTGHWVKIQYDTLVGFAFDGFLSALPVPRENIISKENRGLINENNSYRGQQIEKAFQEYIQQEFVPVCEPVDYYNGFDGEGTHAMQLQKLSRDFTVIHHGGWEGWGTELIMPKVRLSEIKNLIILLAYRSGADRTLFEEVKSAVKNISEERRPLQVVFTQQMFEVKLKNYSNGDAELKWSLELDCDAS